MAPALMSQSAAHAPSVSVKQDFTGSAGDTGARGGGLAAS